MWIKIKSWFKKEKVTPIADRKEPTYQFPPKQKIGKSSQTTTAYSSPPTQTNDTMFQDLALTYLVLDSFSEPSVSHKNEVIQIPETQSFSSEPSTSWYSSSNDDSSRYTSSSSDYSSYGSSSSDYSSDSSSSSSYSSD